MSDDAGLLKRRVAHARSIFLSPPRLRGDGSAGRGSTADIVIAQRIGAGGVVEVEQQSVAVVPESGRVCDATKRAVPSSANPTAF